uniref:Uncharacterized protein n=1 Tax=Picea sitchensis TaxID=3332 RepID=A9NMD4_PICSI|nr:unknown [Picea sitchensis]
MEMRIASAPLIILIAMLMVVTMVSESSASRPLQLEFIFQGDEMENNNNIKMKNGWFESLRGPVTPSGPSNCQNFRSPSGGGSCPVNEINAAGINALTDRSIGITRVADTSDSTVKSRNSKT